MNNVLSKFFSWGIAAKLVTIFVIFGAVPMTAVGLIAFGAADDMKVKAGGRFMSEAMSLADKIDRNLFERYGDVQAFGYNDVITRTTQWYDSSELNGASQVMNKYVKAYGIYDLTLLVDTAGELIAVNFQDAQGEPINTEFLFQKNFKETAWFQALEAGKFTTNMAFTAPGNDISSGTFIEDVHIDEDVKQAFGNDGLVMGFSAPVYEENGTVVAYWSNRTNFNVIETMFADVYVNLKEQGFPSTELTLLDSVGRILVDYDPTTTGTTDIVRNLDVFMQMNLAEKGVGVAQAAVRGESGFDFALHARKQINQVGGYSHLQGAIGFPGMNWSVLVRVPEAEAVAEANAIQSKILMTGFICLAVLIPLGWWVGRKGAGQVRTVQEAADQMAKGEYGARVTVHSQDEIGQLGTAFNLMAQEIQSNIAQGKEFEGKMAAVSKAQAVVEFQMDGTILTANDNFCQTLGYPLAEIQGQHHRMFVDPADASSPAYAAFWAKLNRGEYDAGVYKRIGKSGKEVWIQASYNPILDAQNKPWKVVKLATDITAEKNTAADFEGKMTAISKAQAVVEFQMDGTILTANDNFCQTLGYRLEEIQGQHHRLFADPADASSSAYAAFWAKLNRGEFDAGVYKRIGKGGKEVWIQASYNPIFDANHKPCKVVKFATDITGQKQAQNEVERLIEAAAQGQLAERIATAQFEGSSKELTEGFNRLLTAVETPLTEARTVLVALADGDLSQQMTGQYEGQFGEIKSSLNTAIVNLTGIVQSVREGAAQVSTGAEEITKGNEDLSQRTSAQVGALEETSASMEEMTSTIKQNADNAKEANQLAVTAREVAEKGGAVTEKAVSAMGEINKSSKKIADIINVIDEIAFQTNLLALNAAVEAARAGEQGRGFAVVASEVRNLAQRSATAAKEIKALINESVQKVGDGSDLVNQSGQTLEEIVNSVKRVTDIIAEISAASQEQASGIDQVNKAVIQMDQGTQQNAALVEEATSASQSMRQQAAGLLDQVAFFKVSETEVHQSRRDTTTSLPKKAGPSRNALKPTRMTGKDPVKPSVTPSPQPVGVGPSNESPSSKKDEDFFEEF